MKFENAIEIHLDNVILLGNKRQFKLQGYDNKLLQPCNWCYLKQLPNQIFCLYQNIIKDPNYRDELDKEIFNSDVKIVDFKESIYRELDRIFRDNINKFVEKNINNIAYFFDYNANDYQKISVYEMGVDLREKIVYGIDTNINILLNNFQYKDIANGIVELSTRDGKEHLIFDMKTMKFENDDIDIFKKVYRLPTLKKFLAYEQYKRGITPPFYNEVAKINQFLEGKKTVTLLFSNEYEKQVPAQISQILATNGKEFWINTQVDNMDISNLRAIRYGKKELPINIENLKSLDKQLDEMLANNEQNLEKEELEIES